MGNKAQCDSSNFPCTNIKGKPKEKNKLQIIGLVLVMMLNVNILQETFSFHFL